MIETETKELFRILNTIEGTGSYISTGVSPFTFPGLHIKGLGELAFPINDIQAKAVIETARQAPFGKGSETVTDTKIRNTWEIDAGQLSFSNPDWKNFMKKTLKQVAEGLGIDESKVKAKLYKLLIYEKGGFFLPHRDSEKEKGMFGSLVICLPSKFKGGELAVRFEGQEEVVDFSDAASSYSIGHAAFYADCEHEVKPVKSGYRICLAYNLIQTKGKNKISSPKFASQAEQLVELFEGWKTKIKKPSTILLGHQYTPENFSHETLKNNDLPRAEAILEALDKAGYMAILGLVTSYTMGDLIDYDYDYRRYRGSRNSERSMGAIHDEELYADNLLVQNFPNPGRFELDKEDIIRDFKLEEGDPIDKYEEEFTGNAGMTMEYWYHYGAIVFWPFELLPSILYSKPTHVQLEWISYFSDRLDQQNLPVIKSLFELLGEKDHSSSSSENFNSIPDTLVKINDVGLLRQECKELLSAVFEHIHIKNWIKLFEVFPSEVFEPIIDTALAYSGDQENHWNKSRDYEKKRKIALHWLEILQSLAKSPTPDFVQNQLRKLPAQIEKIALSTYWPDERYSSKEPIRNDLKLRLDIVELSLRLSEQLKQDKDWINTTHEAIMKDASRKFFHKILAPNLLQMAKLNNPLRKSLHKTLVEDMKIRTATKPSPPADWSREIPDSTARYDGEVWKILAPFLESPTQRVFEYRKAQQYRNAVKSAIESVTIDLKMETIKKGSPHTLKITKTKDAYERVLLAWNQDLSLLKKLGTSFH